MQDDIDNLSLPPDGRPMELAPRWKKDFPIDIPRASTSRGATSRSSWS